MADILAPHFTDADKAREYLEALRWPDGVISRIAELSATTTSCKALAHAPTCGSARIAASNSLSRLIPCSRIARLQVAARRAFALRLQEGHEFAPVAPYARGHLQVRPIAFVKP